MVKNKIKKTYLPISEELNALDYLKKAYYYINQTEKDNMAWKWVVLALHGALYGFAICACKGTSPNNVIEIEKNRKKSRKKSRKESRRLISFDKALKLCQNSKWMRMTVMSKHLQLSLQQKDSIRFLKKILRNNFEHYIPMRLYIEVHGMPQITLDVLDVIKFLALNTGNFVNLSQSQQERIELIITDSKTILKHSTLYKEGNEKGIQ